jgi:hypothetical protein
MALTWQQHQQNIFAGESGGDYDALYGYQNRPDGKFSGVKVSEMPIADVIKFTSPSGEYGQYVKGQVGRVATPVGAYQVVGSTLRGAVEALGLDPSQKFDKATQDKIGQYILKTQGTGAWEGYGKGGAAMAQQPQQQPQGLLGGLLGGQGIGGALGLSDDFRDRLAMGIMAGSDPRQFAPLIQQRAAGMKERKEERKLEEPKKATIDYLRKQGFGEIADLVDAGSITASAGATLAYQEGQAIKGLERSMALEAFKAGIKPEKPLTELAKIQADYAAGRLSPEQYETAVQVYANKNKMGLRVGADGAIQFTQGGDFKFTEQQSKDNVYATRAAGALEAFEPVASALTSFPMRAAEFDPTGVARGAVQSDEFQLAQQSGNEFLQAVLRKDTGAAITPNEMVLYGKTYLPQPGDNEKVLAQKSLARKRAVAAIQSGMSPLQILTSEKALAAGRPADQASTAPTGDLSMLSDEELDALIGDLSGGQKK